MEATYINANNAEFFVQFLPEELAYEATILIGALDEEETACGVLAASEQQFGEDGEKVINLLYLYVHPDYRRMGAGTLMLQFLIEYAIEKGFVGIQTQYQATNEQMSLWNFLKNQGFSSLEDEEDEIDYRVPFSSLKDKLTSANIKTSDDLVFFEELSRIQWNKLQLYVDDMWKKSAPGAFTLLQRDAYSKQFSCVAFDKEELSGCGLVTICRNGDIEFKEFYVADGNVKLLGRMLAEVGKRISASADDNTMIRIIPSSGQLSGLLTSEGVTGTNLVYQFIDL